jgi:putative oxidoreductase
MKRSNGISWILQIIIAIILAQALFFKFTGAPESVELFSKVGMEPHGRILTGILELVAVILILIPQSVIYGAILSLGLMSGAILAHIFKVGFQGDAGSLAAMAIAVWIGSIIVIYLRRQQLTLIGDMFSRDSNPTK